MISSVTQIVGSFVILNGIISGMYNNDKADDPEDYKQGPMGGRCARVVNSQHYAC